MKKGLLVKYHHSKDNGYNEYWNIVTKKYFIIFNIKIPYYIKFGESKEFLELIEREKNKAKRKD